MTPDRLEQLARECILEDWDEHIPGYYREMNIARFATLIRNETLEEAAKACDACKDEYGGVVAGPFATDFGKAIHEAMAAGAMNCAAEIRAMKAKDTP